MIFLGPTASHERRMWLGLILGVCLALAADYTLDFGRAVLDYATRPHRINVCPNQVKDQPRPRLYQAEGVI